MLCTKRKIKLWKNIERKEEKQLTKKYNEIII